MQPLHGDDAVAGAQMVSAIATDTAARLLAARFASSTAIGATELAQEVAAEAEADPALVRWASSAFEEAVVSYALDC